MPQAISPSHLVLVPERVALATPSLANHFEHRNTCNDLFDVNDRCHAMLPVKVFWLAWYEAQLLALSGKAI